MHRKKANLNVVSQYPFGPSMEVGEVPLPGVNKGIWRSHSQGDQGGVEFLPGPLSRRGDNCATLSLGPLPLDCVKGHRILPKSITYFHFKHLFVSIFKLNHYDKVGGFGHTLGNFREIW